MESFSKNDIFCVNCNLSSYRLESVQWEPLPMDWLKLNINVAVDANNGVVGYGVVVRNHYGLVMAAGITRGIFSDDVDVAEPKALCFARKVSLSPVTSCDLIPFK